MVMKKLETLTSKSFTELSAAEIELLKEEILNNIFSSIESEQSIFPEVSLAYLKVADKRIPFHKNFVYEVRKLLQEVLNENELNKLLNTDVFDNDSTRKLNDWLRTYAQLLKDAVFEGGYQLTEEDKVAFNSFFTQAFAELRNFYKDSQLSNSKRIAQLEQEVQELKNQFNLVIRAFRKDKP
jgi:hypothetical protein